MYKVGVKPKVSIVIPVYNGSNYLKEAIDSALAQTYKNIEVIVVNDGSTDNGATEIIAQSYGDKIRYFVKENGGVATALNFGINKMTGEYFSWLSHDDMYEKSKIKDQIEYLNKLNNHNVIVASNVRMLFTSGIKKKIYINEKTFNYFDIFLATSAIVGVNGCSMLIPKGAFKLCGKFDVNLPVTQDYDLWFRMKDKYKFKLLDKHLVVSRIHSEQDSEIKKDLMIRSGDSLHFGFLQSIPYGRFADYFNSDVNIDHTMKNYYTYRDRGYLKTASMILKIVLKYYREDDVNKFHSIFIKEIELPSLKPVRDNEKYGLLEHALPEDINKLIDKEYEKLLATDSELPLRTDRHVQNHDVNKSGAFYRLKLSIERDGILLSIEKIMRKLYSKITRK